MTGSFLPRTIAFYHAPNYFRQILQITIPITIQQLMMSSLNTASVVIIGQKGEVAAAAVAE